MTTSRDEPISRVVQWPIVFTEMVVRAHSYGTVRFDAEEFVNQFTQLNGKFLMHHGRKLQAVLPCIVEYMFPVDEIGGAHFLCSFSKLTLQLCNSTITSATQVCVQVIHGVFRLLLLALDMCAQRHRNRYTWWTHFSCWDCDCAVM